MKPVWAPSEYLFASLGAPRPEDGSFVNELQKAFPARVEPGKADHFIPNPHSTVAPHQTTVLPKYLYGGGHGYPLTNQWSSPNTYYLADAHGNTTFGYTGTTSSVPAGPGHVQVRLEAQTSAPQLVYDKHGYTLRISCDDQPSWPSGTVTATLGVTGTDPADSQAFTVTQPYAVTFSHPTFYTVTNVIVVDADMASTHAAASPGGPRLTTGGQVASTRFYLHTGTDIPFGYGGWTVEGENRIVTDSTDTFDIALVNPQGEVMKDAVLSVQPCSFPPPEYAGTCEGGVTSVDGIARNVPQQGGMLVTLPKAPLVPGDYYFRVRPSPGSQLPWVIHGNDPFKTFLHFFAVAVTGAEILDQNFQRVNPISIQDPTPAWVRYLVPGSTVGSLQRKLRSEDSEGTIITQNVDITLTRVGQSSAYLAPVTLLPESASPAARRTLGGSPLEVTVSLGENQAILTTPQGAEDTRCGVAFPAKLQFRFLKRDGSAALTDPDPSIPDSKPGTKQETLIGDKDDNYPEIVKLEIQAVHPEDTTIICTKCGDANDPKNIVQVGLKETPNTNPNLVLKSKVFYDGKNHATELGTNGKINGNWLKLDKGRVTVELRSVADARRATSGQWLPLTTATNTAAYFGTDGAWITVVGKNSKRVTDGGRQYVSQWVDERTYERKRGDALDPGEPGRYWTALL
jgi:hypothetical protein